MKKLFIMMVLALTVIGFTASNAIAGSGCNGPECKNFVAVDIETDVFTPSLSLYKEGSNGGEDAAWMGGYAGYSHDIKAEGSAGAYANGFGEADVKGFGGAFQKEINGGELSGSGALTIGTVYVTGEAHGIDAANCNNGKDVAKVDLEAKGTVMQENGAYSDDKASYIGGSNFSGVDFWSQTDRSDYGSNDRYKYVGTRWERYRFQGSRYAGNGWYKKDIYRFVPDLTADAYDTLGATALTGGGTLVYAKNTKNSAFIAGITGNFGTAMYCGAEHQQTNVYGNGQIGGAAQIPNIGYAGFNASFNYAGQDFGAGVAGGVSQININQTNNSVSVTSNTSAFSGVFVGSNGNEPR